MRSEVRGCDITAVKDDELVVVECKTTLSLKLIYQGVERQESADSVYLAIPVYPDKKIPHYRHLARLLKRLELGLITVTFLKTKKKVDVLIHPKEWKKRRAKKKRMAIIREMEGRSGNYNTGGSRSKIMTAYKENALLIAHHLAKGGAQSSPQLKKLGTGDKTYTILYKNFYGWFEKERKGVYNLTSQGHKALDEHKELIAAFKVNSEEG